MINPLVSIVIPCRNSEDSIGESIESATAQTYRNVEVIVIDDGSTDNSLGVIQSFGDRIRFESRKNVGAAAARNRGIKLARGELIQFLDSDDLLHPGKLERMVPVAMKDTQVHIVVCDWECVAVGKTASELQRLGDLGECKDHVVWCTHHRLPTCAPLHWKSVLLSVGGFDEDLPCSQERDLHLRLACHGFEFIHIREALVKVRRRANSLSSDSIKVLRQHRRIVGKAHELLKELGGEKDIRAEALAGLLARDAREFLRVGLRKEANEYFLAAHSIHRTGGLGLAYKPWHRAAVQVVGATMFEYLVGLKRSLARRLHSARRASELG